MKIVTVYSFGLFGTTVVRRRVFRHALCAALYALWWTSPCTAGVVEDLRDNVVRLRG
jgi:hypothetical protein